MCGLLVRISSVVIGSMLQRSAFSGTGIVLFCLWLFRQVSLLSVAMKCFSVRHRSQRLVKIEYSVEVPPSDLVQARCSSQMNSHTFLSAAQDPLIAVEPHMPPTTNEGSETSFRHDHCKHFQKIKHLLRSEVSWWVETLVQIELHWSTCQKEPFLRSELTAALISLDMLDAGRSPNADSLPTDHLITVVKLKKKT